MGGTCFAVVLHSRLLCLENEELQTGGKMKQLLNCKRSMTFAVIVRNNLENFIFE